MELVCGHRAGFPGRLTVRSVNNHIVAQVDAAHEQLGVGRVTPDHRDDLELSGASVHLRARLDWSALTGDAFDTDAKIHVSRVCDSSSGRHQPFVRSGRFVGSCGRWGPVYTPTEATQGPRPGRLAVHPSTPRTGYAQVREHLPGPDGVVLGDGQGVRAWYREVSPATRGDRPRASPEPARPPAVARAERTRVPHGDQLHARWTRTEMTADHALALCSHRVPLQHPRSPTYCHFPLPSLSSSSSSFHRAAPERSGRRRRTCGAAQRPRLDTYLARFSRVGSPPDGCGVARRRGVAPKRVALFGALGGYVPGPLVCRTLDTLED